MGLRDIGATLPPGFRFYPSDEELVCHYLHNKIINEESLNKSTLIEIDLHICEPWQLPEVAKLNTSEWYFFSFRDRKYATGFRANRATTCGYWKATGKDRVILDPKTKVIVGMRKTLVFYRNRAPNGTKTGWIMHEFRLECPHMPPKEDWVLCRVFHRGKTLENNNNINNINNNNNNQCQYMLENNMTTNNNNNNNNNNNTISPSLLITSPPPSSNTTHYYHQSIPYEGQKPYTYSSNSPSLSQNKPTMINHNISSRYYDEKTSLNGNNGFLQLLKEEDDCEYMWDMNMEENGSNKLGEEGTLLQHGVFEDVRFEDNNISTIFI